jgi:hypothetical protein
MLDALMAHEAGHAAQFKKFIRTFKSSYGRHLVGGGTTYVITAPCSASPAILGSESVPQERDEVLQTPG